MRDQEKEEKGWQHFSSESGIHGVRYLGMKEASPVRRGIWLFFIGVALGYLLAASYLFLRDYDKKLTKTKVKVKNASNLTLPTVTICNRNYWKTSSIYLTNISQEAMRDAEQIMSDVYGGQVESIPKDKYNWSDPRWQPYAMDSEGVSDKVDHTMRSMAHGLEETYKYCAVKGRAVSCSDILTEVKTDAGYCYQFNADGKFYTNAAGMSGGVQLFMNVLSEEYLIGPYSYSEGFFVALHDSGTVPLVAELGYGAAPGTEISLTIQRQEINRQPPPADQSDCFDAETLPNPLKFYKIYSFSACYMECKTSYVTNKCGCRDVLYPAMNDTRVCNYKDMFVCSKGAEAEFLNAAENLEACNCKSTCKEVIYTARTSTYKFPSQQYMKRANSSISVEYMRTNMVFLTLSYGQMSYEILDEERAYTITDLIANLGGTLGVCLGASILSIIEVIEFCIISLSRYLTKCNVQKERTTSTKIVPVESAKAGWVVD